MIARPVRDVARAACLVAAGLALLALTVQGPASVPSAPPSVARATDALPLGVVLDPDRAALRVEQRVRDRLDQVSEHARVAVSIRDEATRSRFDYGSGRFPTASLVKIHLVALMLWQADERGAGLTAAQRQDAEAMLIRSDNDAALRAYFALGGPAGIQRGLESAFGTTGIRIGDRGRWGHSRTTPRAVVALLERVLGPDSGTEFALMHSAMARVVPEQRWGVSALADEGSTLQIKVGWVEDRYGWVANSAGRVVVDGQPVLVSVMSDRHADLEDGIATVEEVARLAGEVVRAERAQQKELPLLSLLRRNAVKVG